MRRVIGFLSVAVLLGFVSGASAQADVAAIIDKAVKAHGGAEKLNKIKCVQSKSKGKLELLGGIDLTQESSVKYPGKFKEVVDMEINGQKINVVTTYDGTKAVITANGNPVPVSDELLKEFKELAYGLKVARLSALLSDKSLQLSLLGEIKVENRSALGVKIASKGHRDIDLYFDKESGLLVKVQSRKLDTQTMQEVDEERIIKEYQDTDGQKAAKKVLINRDGKKYMELEVIEVKYPDDIADSEFDK